MASSYVVLLLFMFIQVNPAQPTQQNYISPPSELSPAKGPISWYSSSGRFAFGFYKQGSGFSVGIRLLIGPEAAVVWTAYRDDPPLSSNATLQLTKDGIILRTDQTKDKVIANSSNSAYSASMCNNGNFEVYNESGGIIWSSFDYPTDTLLGGQYLYAGSELFSNVSKTNSSTGSFRLKMQEDGNLVLYPTNTIDEYPEACWASATNGWEPNNLYLNYTGELLLLNNRMSIIRILSNMNSSVNQGSIIYRATLDLDGVFRLYSYHFDSVYKTSILWAVPDYICPKGFCGFNSYCTVHDNQSICRCLPGTDYVDSNKTSRGCEKNFIEQSCKGMNESAGLYNMIAMSIRWDDYPYLTAYMSEEDCRKSCLEDCNCDAVLYETGLCSKLKYPLKAFRRDSEYLFISYFKTGFKNITIKGDVVDLFESKRPMIVIMLITSGFITCSCVFLAISSFFIFKYRAVKYKWLLETRNLGLNYEHTLRSFYYKELKKATKGFKEELGKGSFGAVYKGALYKGKKLVAVKRLEKLVTDGEREFRSEMHVIGRTHHKNLVRLLGYCAEDSKRLLVYEYMSNGSLADLLFQSERFPDWNERVRIGLDVAREVDKKILENMVKVGLWCVQDEPALRPSMKSVVMMLEGITELEVVSSTKFDYVVGIWQPNEKENNGMELREKSASQLAICEREKRSDRSGLTVVGELRWVDGGWGAECRVEVGMVGSRWGGSGGEVGGFTAVKITMS
ncbi:hypothetical protein Patl1_27803 [Pistacia atlantica]|uniref:Uncharacterized protein n=1 Tax=Pistacia atlantica TaxID=434234 RepID=A0ACC1BE98_9ROSI|nr:hypothetical protein Patl1_27803 [Pistacia atlantica]